jgi:histidinol-phosphate aminotransferase
VSVLNAECALFALEHAEVFAAQAADIRAQRERLLAALAAMPGVQAFPSEGNMILVRVPDATRAFEGMRARGVLIKNVSKMHPLLANCVRLTVGTTDENTQMLAALQASL